MIVLAEFQDHFSIVITQITRLINHDSEWRVRVAGAEALVKLSEQGKKPIYHVCHCS